MSIHIDYSLLEAQRNFLLEYPWPKSFPEEVEGLLNLLDAILDEHWDRIPADANISQELEGQLSLIDF